MHHLFLILLNHSIWQKKTPIEYNKVLPNHWEALCALMKAQAVIGICFDSLRYMAVESLPPQDIYLRYAGVTNYIKVTNNRMKMALKGLYELFACIQIQPLVMKGMSFAMNYPNPSMRMCGDIDLFIPNKYEEAIEFLKNKGYKLEYMEKHYKFMYEGILIELHHNIINSPFKEIDHYTIRKIVNNDFEFTTFDLQTEALLLITHAASHLVGPGIGFRHLCDWVVFLNKHGKEIDFIELDKEIKKRHLKKFYHVFTTVAHNVLDCCIPQTINIDHSYLVEKLTNDLFNQGDCGQIERNRRMSYNRCIYVLMYLRRLLKFLPFSSRITMKVLRMKIKELSHR